MQPKGLKGDKQAAESAVKTPNVGNADAASKTQVLLAEGKHIVTLLKF